MAKTIPQVFFETAKKKINRVFEIAKIDGKWEEIKFGEAQDVVLNIAKGLIEIGAKKEDRIAIIGNTQYLWTHIDLGIQTAGCITVPVYPTLHPENQNFIVSDSGAEIVFCENEKIANKINAKRIILFEKGEFSLKDLIELGKKSKAKIPKIKEDDIATIVYTSGTTGVPKGVIQKHKNILSMVSAVSEVIKPREDDIILAWLPFAHTFGRLVIFYSIFTGVPIAYAENITKIMDNIKEIKPTIFPSVPRIYEKAYQTIMKKIQSDKIKKFLFEMGLKIGKKKLEYDRYKEPMPLHLSISYKIFDKLIFSKIREAFGGRIRLCSSGGAALSKEIGEFFYAIGIKILEGYGLTETCPVLTANREDRFKFGTVGLPIPNVKIRIAEDGEIQVKAPQVVDGYWMREEETKSLFTKDGWMKTGDIGFIDNEGFLHITGRKKEIIVTSFGKNVAPAPIEAKICEHPFISFAALYGDEKPYIVALISPNIENIKSFAKEKGINLENIKDILSHKIIYEEIKKHIDKVNENLQSWEKIAKFVIIPEEWMQDQEITPTLKVKKDFVFKKYKDILENLYL